MWKLSELALRNIISFREAELKIEQGVATLIFGQNKDNASQPCNGSGKSSLIEAISFALTGEPLRKVKSVEEIINDLATEAYVSLKLENDYDDTIFTIERTISRKGSQVIECHKYNSDGEEIELDKTRQPSVLDYNRYILDEIGLSKDDIYNNFILCDTRYDSFFDSSDKNKKEIINSFSNGTIIDESIARLQEDIDAVKADRDEADKDVMRITGAIIAIEKELEDVDEKNRQAKFNREQQILKIEGQILEERDAIRQNQINKKSHDVRLKNLQTLQVTIGELKDSDLSLHDAYHRLAILLSENEIGSLNDYDQLSSQLTEELTNKRRVLSTSRSLMSEIEKSVEEWRGKVAFHQSEYDKHIKETDGKINECNDTISRQTHELQQLESRLDEIEGEISKNKKLRIDLEAKIAKSEALLKGAIICPNCQYKFFAVEEKSYDEVKSELADLSETLSERKQESERLTNEFDKLDIQASDKDKEIEKIEQTINLYKHMLQSELSEVNCVKKALEDEVLRQATLQKDLVALETEIDRTNGKIEVLQSRMFNEADGLVESQLSQTKSRIERCESDSIYREGKIDQYRQSLEELKSRPDVDFATSLNTSLRKYQSELSGAEKVVEEIQHEYNILKAQEVNFTLFKSHIARKKIDALSLIVNDFLEKIGSDIRLKLEGFTMTKQGKLRDKISVQVMRDGIDCGSYQKFSGGEKARLNLACILSLHTLTNANCESGKGLDFIIIDELLDKSDEVGMATYCEALNSLGQTSLLITQGAVAESYPHKLLIVKEHGVSTIDNN